MRIPFIAGNWKMHKTVSEATVYALQLKELYHDTDVKTAIFVPYTHLTVLSMALSGSGIGIGAQNVHFEKEGAYTGEVSVEMLEELGVSYCLVGHSERRQYFAENDETVNLKLKALLNSEITPVLCVGEDLKQRDAGKEEAVVSSQIKAAFDGIGAADAARVVIAYEPVWAIGTGKTATPQQANEMCAFVRRTLTEIYDEEMADMIVIQYGGSVTPENATEIMNMDEIDGALVGGASLDPLKFIEIINF